MGFIRTVIDFILPPAPDAQAASQLTAHDLVSLATPMHRGNTETLFPYREPRVRAMIKAIKYYGETSILPALGAIAAEHLAGIVEDRALDGCRTIMVPIPSSPARLRARGYNQAERIALAIHRALGNPQVEWAPGALERHDRPTQVHTKKSRAENIKGAFYVPQESSIEKARIILIDDVIESGATMEDATRALIAAGAAEVIGYAIAH